MAMQFFTRMRNWWLALSGREQRLVVMLGMVVAVFTVFFGVYRPIAYQIESSHSRLESEQVLLTWVEKRANQIVELRKHTSGTEKKRVPFNQAITISARRFGLQLIRIQPGSDSFQIWLKPSPFNQLVTFLDYLQSQYGIRVEALDINRLDKPGMVEIKRLQMSSPK